MALETEERKKHIYTKAILERRKQKNIKFSIFMILMEKENAL